MNTTAIPELIAKQRIFFNSGTTRPVSFRKAQLKKLYNAILDNEKEILSAVHKDLGKSDFEAFTTEIVLVLDEIKIMLRNCGRWSRADRRQAGLFNFPASAHAYKDPHGVCLVMSPWNYPFQLALMPLVGAIAAGNTVVIKTSEYAQATSTIITKLIGETFAPEYVAVVEGDREVNQEILAQHFDYIFFTGSVEVGKIVMQSAAKFLTPVTLELGGKSPCIIDKTANIDLSARRVVWGKCINSGQTCIAPDYFLVHEEVKDAFITALKKYIHEFYGPSPHTNTEYPHIISRRHYDRLARFIEARPDNTILTGGRFSVDTLHIEPAIIENTRWDDPVMQEEIFGPIMPILTWNDETEIIQKILDRPRPLALYLFSRDKKQQKRITGLIPFGGGCINDTIMHVGTNSLPFGGTGASGMGGYHGKASFDTFSRIKAVINKSLLVDVDVRYPPFTGKYRKFRKFL